jgi:hypothetical protein
MYAAGAESSTKDQRREQMDEERGAFIARRVERLLIAPA